MKTFCGDYGRQKLTFYKAPFKTPLRAFAVLLFAWRGDEVVVCDILDRGWCVPSGRVEPGEDSLHAVCREAREEAGLCLTGVTYIGCYKIDDRSETRWADCFAARVGELKEIEKPDESLGVRLVKLDKLPCLYHLWNDVTECVFKYSYEVIQRSEKLGIPPCPPPLDR